jgi:hypothetical protein
MFSKKRIRKQDSAGEGAKKNSGFSLIPCADLQLGLYHRVSPTLRQGNKGISYVRVIINTTQVFF